jgi:hypothetical protein
MVTKRPVFVIQPCEETPVALPLALCRDCHEKGATYHGNQLCEGCYTERINGAGIFEDDDLDPLFGDDLPANQERLAHIVCCVCEKPTKIAIGAPARLCGHCSADPAATDRHIQNVHVVTVRRFCEAWRAFDVVLAAAPAEVQERWVKVEQARATQSPRFTQAWSAAKAAGGDFAMLLGFYEDVERVADECNRVFEWVQRAVLEVEQLGAER